MMNEETLFAAALEKPAGAERRAFLEAACGADVRLRDRLGRLLAADERSGGVLDGGAGAAPFLPTRDDQPPDTRREPATTPVAPPGYELAGVIGEGGMGVVYQARHVRLARQVAVKVLHPRFAPDGPAAERFLGEARVTAQLQHPGVPPVHDVGSLPDGRPFLVMKLIQGQTLDTLLADSGADRSRLTAVFEGVCQAVGYAHSRGVIHRDLKPSNVMVGAFAEVQVMDWGLAREMPNAECRMPNEENQTGDGSATPHSTLAPQLTAAGTVLGTPAFMAPEQARGEPLDARADVFALGGLLCIILTGRPPFVAGNAEATRQLAARGRLGDAFARLDGCGADPGLIALCTQCLAVEPAGRPADAGQVARAVAGLRTAADDRARRAELDVVRAEGETRVQRNRRRAQLALGVGVGLLLAGTAAGIWYADRQAAQRRAETGARHGRNAEAVSALLDQCEAALRDDHADQAGLALEAAEQRAADGGADVLAGRLARCRGDLNLLRELDAIDIFRWTNSTGEVPDTMDTAARWRAALTAAGAVVGDAPAGWLAGSPIRDRVLTAMDGWLAYDPSAGVRAALRSADPHPYRDAVRDALANRDDRQVVSLVDRPEAVSQPARFAAVLGQLRGISADRRRAVLEAAHRARPGELSLLMGLGNTYPVDSKKGADERVRWFQAAVAAHPRNTAARNNLAIALCDKGEKAAAVATLREATELDPGYANGFYNLGVVLSLTERFDDAIAAYREAARLRPAHAATFNNLGTLLAGKNDWPGAIANFRLAVEKDKEDPRYPHNLGSALKDAGDVPGAVAAYREAVRRFDQFAPSHDILAWILATGPDGVRDGKGAVTHATRACELTFYRNPNYIDTLAAAHAEAGDFEQAVRCSRRAIGKDEMPQWRARLDLYTRHKPYRDPTLVPREVLPPPRPADR